MIEPFKEWEKKVWKCRCDQPDHRLREPARGVNGVVYIHRSNCSFTLEIQRRGRVEAFQSGVTMKPYSACVEVPASTFPAEMGRKFTFSWYRPAFGR